MASVSISKISGALCFGFVLTLAVQVLQPSLAGQSAEERRSRMMSKKARRGEEIKITGVREGERVPGDIEVYSSDGKLITLSESWKDKPALIVTCSLSCPVARGRQPMVNKIVERFGDEINVVMLYTTEAHPLGDPSPYYEGRPGGGENQPAEFQTRQTRALAERQALAKKYVEKFEYGGAMVIDAMDNRSWDVAGRGPNLGLLIETGGKVRVKHGWFDGPTMERSIEHLLKDLGRGAK